MAPDIRFESEVITADEHAVAGRFRASGHVTDGGAVEVEMLQVTANRGDRAWRTELFEPHDEERMLERFAELSREAAAQDRPLVVAARAETIAALNARDWDGLRDRYAPDAVLVDRRRMFGELASGVDAVVDVQRGIVDAVPDVTWSDGVVAIHGDLVATFSAELRGHAPEGGEAALTTIAVIQADRNGRTRRVELFDEEPAALARMHDLGGWTRALERFAATVIAGDWDAVRAFYAPGARFVDHRSGVRQEGEDADFLVKLWQAFAEQASDLSAELHVIDARSSTLAAFELTLSGRAEHGGGAFELITAQVVETDDDHRTVQVVVFDAGDLDAIERCLDELETGTTATRVGLRAAKAFNERAWNVTAELHAPDVVGLDRRAVAGDSVEGREGMLRLMQGIVAVAPDARWDLRAIGTSGDLVAAFSGTFTGHTEGGGDAENPMTQVIQVDDEGRVRLIEVYDDEQAALERMHALGDALAAPR
jgi:ketosteroid isomerase-like protein